MITAVTTRVRGNNWTDIYRVFITTPSMAIIFCTESLHPLGHRLTSEVVLMTAIKKTNCTLQMVIL
jgi:hypothetical protein